MSQVHWDCSTCPQCGATLERGQEAPCDGPSTWKIFILHRPPEWEPQSELDTPAEGTPLEAVEERIGDPYTFVRQYNAASLLSGGTTWAIVTAREFDGERSLRAFELPL